jgi:glycosyltransferase involved in cell wall biosynthesis
VLSLCRAFPEAPIRTSLYDPDGTFPEFRSRTIETLALDHIAPLRRRHRLALPVLPIAWATAHDDSDVVVCSSSGWSHGVRSSGRKIVYCHSPAKWLYRQVDYLGVRPTRGAQVGLKMLSPALRRFDQRAAGTADRYIANSRYIAGEIARVYGIDAEVVPPPAGVDTSGPQSAVPGIEPGFFLTVARLLPYKNVAPTIEAFRGTGLQLVVVGDGPQRSDLSVAVPTNVTLLGEVDDSRLRWLYANCAGLVAASREDFGLTPVEAASFGKPVAALRWGGFLDTVLPGTTGVFFDAPEPAAIAAAVGDVEKGAWNETAIVAHAATFSEARFIERISAIVAETASSRQ